MEQKVKPNSESGQAILEYVMLIAITLSIVIMTLRGLRDRLDQNVPKIGGTFERQLRQGAAPAGIWQK